jgi:hypothetical protein
MQSIHNRGLGFGVVFQMVLGFEVVMPLLSLPIASRNLTEIQDEVLVGLSYTFLTLAVRS